MTETTAEDEWRRWHEAGAFEVAPASTAFLWSCPWTAFVRSSVYAIRSADRLVLLDAGWAIEQAEIQLIDGLDELDVGLEHVTDFLVTHAHRDHYTMAAALRRRLGARLTAGAAERVNLAALAARGPWDEMQGASCSRRHARAGCRDEDLRRPSTATTGRCPMPGSMTAASW